MLSSEKIKERLNAAIKHVSKLETRKEGEKLTEAAVLVAIFFKDDIPFVLLTVRSHNLENYPGQVSLPGGKRDLQDTSLVSTALREAREEIGLPADNLTVLASLPPFCSRKNILVTPVVATLIGFDDFHPVLNPLEVCETFIVPLENFIKKDCHYVKDFVSNNEEGQTWTMDYFEFSQENSYHIIWGLTAVILTAVASIVYDCQPEFTYQDWLLNYDNNELIYKHSLLNRINKL